jgi:hypothetical protein
MHAWRTNIASMDTHEIWRTLGPGLALLTLMAALAACDGSSDTAGSAAVTSAPGSTTSTGSTGSGSPPGGGAPGGTSGATILFEQPQESGIAGHLVVPLADHTSPPTGVFEMVLWQPNPDMPDGQLMPTTWNASSETGFAPSSSLATTQLGFQNEAGTSTAQMDGDVVGAYLNSSNLPGSPDGQKMMITPQFTFEAGSAPVPFSSSNAVLNASMELQIPTALGKDNYVNADFLFKDPNGVRISIAAKIFSNGEENPVVGTGYDVPSDTYMLNAPLGVDQSYLTQTPGSASSTGTPWLGLRHFEWSLSQAQMAAVLKYMVAQYPGKVQSTDPAQYVLAEVHLNAEFHFQPDPAELGWSMAGWKIWLTQSGG